MLKIVLTANAIVVLFMLTAVFGSGMNFNYANGANINSSDPFANSANSIDPFGKGPSAKKLIPLDEGDDGDNISSDSKNVIRGTNGDDFIRGTAHDDIIYGLKGDDQIYRV